LNIQVDADRSAVDIYPDMLKALSGELEAGGRPVL